jgi:hypothetical protein
MIAPVRLQRVRSPLARPQLVRTRLVTNALNKMSGPVKIAVKTAAKTAAWPPRRNCALKMVRQMNVL